MEKWRSFIGLPHATGADPRLGQAADCLLVAFAVRHELNLYVPIVDAEWFCLARERRWADLARTFRVMTRVIPRREGAMSLQAAGVDGELSIGVSVGGGILLTSIKRGVVWLPNGSSPLTLGKRWYEPVPQS